MKQRRRHLLEEVLAVAADPRRALPSDLRNTPDGLFRALFGFIDRKSNQKRDAVGGPPLFMKKSEMGQESVGEGHIDKGSQPISVAATVVGVSGSGKRSGSDVVDVSSSSSSDSSSSYKAKGRLRKKARAEKSKAQQRKKRTSAGFQGGGQGGGEAASVGISPIPPFSRASLQNPGGSSGAEAKMGPGGGRERSTGTDGTTEKSLLNS
uniref:Uncharacterized protein n=1 Tax=Chromera velia CCMP2878 TaxID=1169474 RepID=A0A0G4H954_9ALVE|eukprot:Cvel_25346.t1-p1 / transcript=Cvel_25346.t1 / gene=Cvel_25346 / organism=Chromera_velia_CCMP2878 / gene_product=hypothetical protein / transcript_product=hypothetical protein / location=Cvel_scaffold2859:4463-8375(+) / protein_length=207 / sequence_SO=supercontig / SO=protein_coding / is_pseudo=false